MRTMLLLTAAVFAGAVFADEKPSGFAAEQGKVVDLAPNGAWVWHTDPVTVWHKDRLYFAYVDSAQKAIMISSHDPATDCTYPIEISTTNSTFVDSHDHPAIAVLPDDTLYLTYNRHMADQGFFYRRSLEPTPESIDDLSEESFYKFPSEKLTCYANLYYLEDEGRLHHFLRWLDMKPTWQTSEDMGQTWSDPQIVVTNSAWRPYVHYACNGRDRIDMIYTDGHPRNQKNSVYHMFYKGGAFHKADGTELATAETLPVQNDENGGTVVYEYSEAAWPEGQGIHDWIPNGIGWVWDIEYVAAGEPVAVISVRKPQPEGEPDNNGRIYYYYAWWTAEAGWQKRCIAKAGNQLHEWEQDFAGGICLDPKDPSVVYLSSNAVEPFDLSSLETELSGQDDYKLYRGTFNRKTAVFDVNLFFASPGNIVVRPFVPSGDGPADAVVWMEGPCYPNMNNFPTYLRGWFSE